MYPYIDFLGHSIPAYGLCMCFAFFICGFFVLRKAERLGLLFEDTLILIAVSIGAGLLSGALLYIAVTYRIKELLVMISNGDFSFLKNVGLVFYGGLIGGVLGGLICSKLLNINIVSLERCVVPYVPIGHAIGRIGCLLAGCCYGFPYDGVFAVRSVFSPGSNTYFPVQIVEAFFDVLIAVFLLFYTKKERSKYNVLFSYLCLYSILRFCLEFLRGDEIRGSVLFFSTSQWISVLIFVFCILVMGLRYIKNKKN